MKTKFIPIDYDYFDFKGRNYIKIIGRDDNQKRICIIDTCKVYLWAILEENLKKDQIEKIIDKIKKIKIELKGRTTKIDSVELHEKNFMGRKVKALKIFATNYKDLHDVADKLDIKEITNRRGYDLGYITHYIIEKQIKPLNWYEISGEVLNNSLEFGGIDMGLDVDICIKLETSKEIKDQQFNPKILAYDIETDELQIGKGEILMISLVGENFKKVITWKKSKTKNESIEFVKDEAELIGKIKGITHIDILKFIRTAYAQYMKSETLSLNEVAKEFLQDTKIDFELKHSSKIEDHNWEKYYEYNLQDSILTLKLFEKFWPDLLEFTKITNEPIFDLSRAGLSKYMESYILQNLNKFNEIPQKRPGYNEIKERQSSGGVEGAFVLEPKPGLYENIAMFDFTSMHTSIIITHNISGSTLLEKKEKNCFESPELELQGKKTKFYFSKEKGFFPSLLEELFNKRKQYKAEYKKNKNSITLARSNAFKVLSASAHGYLGFFGARYYSIESSASVLAYARKFNIETIEKTEIKRRE